jgi:hypothetical protein
MAPANPTRRATHPTVEPKMNSDSGHLKVTTDMLTGAGLVECYGWRMAA